MTFQPPSPVYGPSFEDLFNSDSDFLDDLSSSDDEMQDQIAQVPDATDPSGQMGTSQVAPQTPDQATAGFTAEQRQVGLNQNQQPDQTQAFKQAEKVPGGPEATSTNIVPVTTDPAGTANAAFGPSPLGNVAADRRQGHERQQCHRSHAQESVQPAGRERALLRHRKLAAATAVFRGRQSDLWLCRSVRILGMGRFRPLEVGRCLLRHAGAGPNQGHGEERGGRSQPAGQRRALAVTAARQRTVTASASILTPSRWFTSRYRSPLVVTSWSVAA